MNRKTNQRKAIEQVFKEQQRPLSVEEILTCGREIVATLNQATVYRNVKLLSENGWLEKVSHPVFGTLYERSSKEHHHHFHCHQCNRAFELPGCALKIEDATPEGFVVEDHDVFLFGTCPSCSQLP